MDLYCLDWFVRDKHPLDGDSLSYLDMVERSREEEERRIKERIMMEEGRWKEFQIEII